MYLHMQSPLASRDSVGFNRHSFTFHICRYVTQYCFPVLCVAGAHLQTARQDLLLSSRLLMCSHICMTPISCAHTCAKVMVQFSLKIENSMHGRLLRNTSGSTHDPRVCRKCFHVSASARLPHSRARHAIPGLSSISACVRRSGSPNAAKPDEAAPREQRWPAHQRAHLLLSKFPGKFPPALHTILLYDS